MNKEIRSKRKKKKIDIEEETEAVANNKAVRSKRKKKMNRSLSHLFAGRSAIKKMNMEETEAVASNKAVRSKRKMKKKEETEELTECTQMEFVIGGLELMTHLIREILQNICCPLTLAMS
jgi:hypothetical protein